jgi:hypothetical protein
MGWNDQVDFIETECLQCGETAVWEYWNAVAQSRYVGRTDAALDVIAARSDRCPHCGSMNGRIVEADGC